MDQVKKLPCFDKILLIHLSIYCKQSTSFKQQTKFFVLKKSKISFSTLLIFQSYSNIFPSIILKQLIQVNKTSYSIHHYITYIFCNLDDPVHFLRQFTSQDIFQILKIEEVLLTVCPSFKLSSFTSDEVIIKNQWLQLLIF